ncbi:MAG: AraC family transcriptional regulator [Bacteroidales bacterium]|jgi:AraC-like DNA-binding protein|nr:AraC family transcriptional regulator [Bacteroidales bacterium]MCI1785118.1 AraC family transcriptional regulator [Bacteroidales bacterium]
MSEVLTEITPLSEKDCFHIVERHKKQFTYPLHRHKEFEINFIEHASGVRRIVGDSVETIGDYDLVLIAGEGLEHVWEQGTCKSPDIREITIQFSPGLFDAQIYAKNQFASISSMLKKAEHGLAFPLETIMKVYNVLDTLASEPKRFVQFLKTLYLLYELSVSEGSRILASSSFAHAERNTESRRVAVVKQYINDHYQETLRLADLAGLVGMSPVAFSRFFRLRSGKTLSGYIEDVRLGYAARMLVDTTKNVSEICYECGFNNLSNFNRIFKSCRGSTPRAFREMYRKNMVTI